METQNRQWNFFQKGEVYLLEGEELELKGLIHAMKDGSRLADDEGELGKLRRR